MADGEKSAAERRIAAIGKRANALRRAGWYTAEDLEWLKGYVRQEGTVLAEVEALIYEAERASEHVVPAEPWRQAQ